VKGAVAERGRAEIVLLGQARFAATRGLALSGWLADLVGELAPDADSFALRLVGDRTMVALQREFRGLDQSTDVLSFPGESSLDGLHLGDVVISVPRAAAQAAERGHSLERELRLLALHGVLHCLGHDHETDDGEMERLEARLRRRWLDREG